MNYVTIASTFSGNKGAASMLEASIQTLSSRDKEAKFTVLTVYPEEDKILNTYKNVTVLGAKPLFLGAVLNPLTLLYKLLPPFRPLLKRQQHVKALAEADVLLDQGGITFVDGRAKFLVYNAATLLPGLFTNTKVIKCSQAMGPFNTLPNKLCAKLLLPKLNTICARGDITLSYLNSLNLKNVISATDYAFLMGITPSEAKKADQVLKDSGFVLGKAGKTIAVLPSEVVRKKTESTGQDYIGFNAEFIKGLLAEGYHVLLLAYSARAGRESRHNNDLPVCRGIAQQIDYKNFTFIDDELSAQVLRHIIGKVDVVVTSRFHAMVASLSMNVPPLIVGWSHKYEEIMSMFELTKSALDSKKLDQKALKKSFNDLVKNREQSVTLIKKHLPLVRKSAETQVNTILNSTSS